MISRTIESELNNYRIGEKIRALRTERGLRLIELGQHTGLSVAMLSKIESGKAVPTLPTLTRIALAFSMGLDYFFSGEPARHAFGLTRRADRIRLAPGPGAPYEFESLDYTIRAPALNAWLADFKDVADAPAHSHAGVEFIFLTAGRLELTWNDRSHILEEGDSVYFDSSLEHSYRKLNRDQCQGVVVTLRGRSAPGARSL